MDLHRRIRTLRLRRGMTGLELARRAGVSPSYVSLIEHGEKVPSERVAVRIAQALDEREEDYRVWAATARLDERTRQAVLRMRPAETAPRPSGRPGPETDGAPGRGTAPGVRRPPGRPRTRSRYEFEVAYRLDDEARAPVLRVPLLAPGAMPQGDRPEPDQVEALLAVDARMLDRDSARGLVALRVDDTNGREVASWLRPGDVVVLDRRPGAFDPALLQGFRLDDGFLLARGSVGPGVLLVLPDPSHAGSPRVVPLSRPEDLAEVHVGSVIWSSRVWPA
ncbi:MAG: helix-turn-helix domain-containing protein [Acidobacteria bacterium]|nr:helix-turn-helix domain-containing protein [Acidobacteriota bacterium]